MPESRPLISVVVSTYDKPRALLTALRSLQAQTVGDWRAVVIGDACGPATGEAVAACADARIAYRNLPMRCGEQSGPNSIGLSAANGAYVAFLNHDDVLLPDHFVHLLALAQAQRADFVLGRTAHTRAMTVQPDGSVRPRFYWARPAAMRPALVFHRGLKLIEPSSSWLVRREAAQRVGPWRLSTTVRRHSIVDWFLRAWREGLRIAFADRITCLKNGVPGTVAGWRGYGQGPEHAWLCDAALRLPPDETRAIVAADLACGEEDPRAALALDPTYLPTRWARAWYRLLINPATAALYRLSGWDAMAGLQAVLGMPRGYQGRQLSLHRTGQVPQRIVGGHE